MYMYTFMYMYIYTHVINQVIPGSVRVNVIPSHRDDEKTVTSTSTPAPTDGTGNKKRVIHVNAKSSGPSRPGGAVRVSLMPKQKK